MYRYSSPAALLALVPLLQTFSASATPLYYKFPRDGGVSVSYAKLSKPIVSPYYVYFGNPQTKKLADAFDSLNMKVATVGFASAPEGKCELTEDLKGLVDDVNAFIGKGGAVSLSFGGNLQDKSVEARQHVQQACTDAPSLTKLIEDAMTQFNTHNVEFDIEDDDLIKDKEAAKRLAQALVQVKKDMPDTFITYTVGSNPSGMPGQQKTWVQAAKDNDLTIDSLILMTMNMGAGGTGDNVKDTQTAITGGANQLAKIYGIDVGDAIKKMGMLPAIGVDNDGKIIDIKGIATLGQFAKDKSISTVSYWNFNRDFPGDVGSKQQSLEDSSSPDQKDASQFLTTILDSVSGAASDTASKSKAVAPVDGLTTGAAAGAGVATGAKSKAVAPVDGVETGVAAGAEQAPDLNAPPPPSDQQPGQKLALPSPSADKAPAGSSST